MNINTIAVVDENWGIGFKGDLLVHLPQDLKFFQRMTLGKTVVMGEVTFYSLPGKKPLRERRNIVLSDNPEFRPAGVSICRSLAELESFLPERSDNEIWIIGGASVYEQLLPCCRLAYITHIEEKFAADRFFPDLQQYPNWQRKFIGDAKEHKGIFFKHVIYENRDVKRLSEII